MEFLNKILLSPWLGMLFFFPWQENGHFGKIILSWILFLFALYVRILSVLTWMRLNASFLSMLTYVCFRQAYVWCGKHLKMTVMSTEESPEEHCGLFYQVYDTWWFEASFSCEEQLLVVTAFFSSRSNKQGLIFAKYASMNAIICFFPYILPITFYFQVLLVFYL